MRLRLLAIIAAAVVLVGCGGGPSETVDSRDAAPFTAGNLNVRIHEGWMKLKTAHMSMTMGSGPNRMTAKGMVINGPSFKTSGMRATYKTPGPDFEMRMVKGIIYMNLGQVTEDKFVAIDPADTANELSRQFAPMVESLDPAAMLRQMSGAVTKVERRGDPKDLDGVETIRYAVTIDTDRMKLGDIRDGISKGALPKKLNYTFYIGPDDVPRKMVFHGGPTEAPRSISPR